VLSGSEETVEFLGGVNIGGLVEGTHGQEAGEGRPLYIATSESKLVEPMEHSELGMPGRGNGTCAIEISAHLTGKHLNDVAIPYCSTKSL
jgi:hypothetical protein